MWREEKSTHSPTLRNPHPFDQQPRKKIAASSSGMVNSQLQMPAARFQSRP